jgi:hypothetical protein
VPRSFTVDQLRDMVEHVHYEATRLVLWSTHPIIANSIVSPSPGLPDDAFANLLAEAVLEARLVHLRSVSEFLTTPIAKKRHHDNLVGDDYFDEDWATRPRKLLGNTRDEHLDTMNEMNHRLAHVSIGRLDEQDESDTPGFHWGVVLDRWPSVIDAFGQFVRDLHAVHPERGQWFVNFASTGRVE